MEELNTNVSNSISHQRLAKMNKPSETLTVRSVASILSMFLMALHDDTTESQPRLGQAVTVFLQSYPDEITKDAIA